MKKKFIFASLITRKFKMIILQTEISTEYKALNIFKSMKYE